MYMLGCVSFFMPLEFHLWKTSISQQIPSPSERINMRAFNMGRKEVRNAHLAGLTDQVVHAQRGRVARVT